MILIIVILLSFLALVAAVAFPRQSALAFLLLACLGALGWALVSEMDAEGERQRRLVSIEFRYGEGDCSPSLPLRVDIRNASPDQRVVSASWEVVARREGHSSSVIAATMRRMSSDRMIAPGETYSMCFKAPPLDPGVDPASLVWEARGASVEFEAVR